MNPAVTFNFLAWTQRYPELSDISETLAQLYFNEACLYCENTTNNPAFGYGILPTLLNMLTAHIAAMNAGVNGQAPSPLTGPITDATEGSVSVHAELGDVTAGSPSEPWYLTTKYGSAYWYATAPFRTAIYSARPTVVVNGAFPLYGRVY